MDSSVNTMVVPTCVVGVFCHCTFFFPTLFFVFSEVFPLISVGYTISPFSVLPHFPHFPLLGFNDAHVFFCFCGFYITGFPRWFPNDPNLFNCPEASKFPLSFRFFHEAGGGRFTD